MSGSVRPDRFTEAVLRFLKRLNFIHEEASDIDAGAFHAFCA